MEEWVEKKQRLKKKDAVRKKLASGTWSLELVVHNVEHPEELELIEEKGIKVHFLSKIVRDLRAADPRTRSQRPSSHQDSRSRHTSHGEKRLCPPHNARSDPSVESRITGEWREPEGLSGNYRHFLDLIDLDRMGMCSGDIVRLAEIRAVVDRVARGKMMQVCPIDQ